VSGVRADRLVAIVLLLQVHGRLSAADIAERLEVSERTARRDLDALCAAGVPVYPQRGRGGGWQLLGGHRLDLSGLDGHEAEALFLATDPGASALAPDLADRLAAVRRKVMAALPEPLRVRAETAAERVLYDPSRWGPWSDLASGDPASESHLGQLRRAVIEERQVVICYQPPGGPAGERKVHPLGLVCKRGVWYLMAAARTGLRSYRVSRVLSVQATDDPLERPAGFDLERAWAEVAGRLAGRAPELIDVKLRVAAEAEGRLRGMLSRWWPVEAVGGAEGPASGGGDWVQLRVGFASPGAAASELAGWGRAVEVEGPGSVRRALAEIGRELAARYG
jgi:predicted DNA-binding transcriptional regulator YafY